MLAESRDEDDDDEEEIESTKDESTTMEDETREGKLKKIIRSTVEYLIQHDQKELLELIKEFRKDVGEDFLIDTVRELIELVDVLLIIIARVYLHIYIYSCSLLPIPTY